MGTSTPPPQPRQAESSDFDTEMRDVWEQNPGNIEERAAEKVAEILIQDRGFHDKVGLFTAENIAGDTSARNEMGSSAAEYLISDQQFHEDITKSVSDNMHLDQAFRSNVQNASVEKIFSNQDTQNRAALLAANKLSDNQTLQDKTIACAAENLQSGITINAAQDMASDKVAEYIIKSEESIQLMKDTIRAILSDGNMLASVSDDLKNKCQPFNPE